MNLTIDPEFQALIPPMRESEREGLEESILADGCREALIVWNGVIVDGHNRYDVCKRHGVEFRVIDRKFDSREAVKLWMIDNQVKHRRNLSDGARFDLIQTRKALLLEQGRKKYEQTVGRPKSLSTVDNDKHNTQKAIAKDLGWSTGKVAQADYVWRHADDETKKKVITDELSINAAYREMKGPRYTITAAPPHVSRSSGENEWYTPPEYIEAARAVLGEIDFDPASSAEAQQRVGAARFLTAEDDALREECLEDWKGRTWMNPPYSGDLVANFIARYCERIEHGIVLVNNATETKWFQQLAGVSNALCMPRGRIRYLRPSGEPAATPLQGQAFLYRGPEASKFKSIFSQFGAVALL